MELNFFFQSLPIGDDVNLSLERANLLTFTLDGVSLAAYHHWTFGCKYHNCAIGPLYKIETSQNRYELTLSFSAFWCKQLIRRRSQLCGSLATYNIFLVFAGNGGFEKHQQSVPALGRWIILLQNKVTSLYI